MVNFAAHGIPITIYRKEPITTGDPPEPVLDAYGNATYSPESQDTFDGLMSSIAPTEVEDQAGRTETTSLMLIAPSDAGVIVGDVLDIDGKRYNPLGSPESWRRYRRQTVDHLEIPLRAGVNQS